MNTKDAVLQVLNEQDISRYRMAKELNIQPIMIKNYIDKGTRMGVKTAAKFLDLYNIEISDIFKNRCDNAATSASDSSE